MAQAKPAQPAQKSGGFKIPSGLVILIAFIVSELVFIFLFGSESNFTDATKMTPKEGNYLGVVYHGGFVVPFLMTMFITVIAFSIERYLSIKKANGTGKTEDFLKTVKSSLNSGNIDAAITACDKQKGSVANVVQSGLRKYKEMQANTSLTTDQKVLSISKEIEESTTLELPMLQKNLSILATLASVATLIALFGTVLGMIRAFAALAVAGTPDPGKLATGISEALVNTAIGIFTSALAIISYNYFTGLIDDLTFSIDEMGFSITQTFASNNN
ncbi:MAG: MotA/TolQ/ExbB proton channel family protein [Chitinophagales bacterium]|nr:MotA/TolQ/ExbB proton channel family protein [Chitinophagales bacterium]MCZ2392946.1 MotA/TolQ/ExbB proton channel family protein [Chitinophagales bacterium]